MEKKNKKGGYKIKGRDLEKFRCFFKLQKIITRKILIVGKIFTYKKVLRISFSIEKKIKKGGRGTKSKGGGEVCKSDSTIEPVKLGSLPEY